MLSLKSWIYPASIALWVCVTAWAGPPARNSSSRPANLPTAKVEKKKTPYFATASVSTAIGLFGEKENEPASARIGGGSASAGNLPNAANLLLIGGHNFSQADKITALYLYSHHYLNREDRGTTISFLPPQQLVGLGYTHLFLKELAFDFAYTYLDTTGIQDPTLNLEYKGKLDGIDKNLGWSLGIGASLPLSNRSRELAKVTTLSTTGGLRYHRRRWEWITRIGYSYTIYENSEIPLADDGSDNDGGGASGVAPGGSLFEEYDNEYADGSGLPSYDVNYLSRELSGTRSKMALNYKFNSMWQVGSAGELSYSYLSHDYARWSSNITVMSIGFNYKGFTVDLAATLTSSKEKTDYPTFPEKWGGRIGLAYKMPLLGTPAP
jgi:hypothetical protein